MMGVCRQWSHQYDGCLQAVEPLQYDGCLQAVEPLQQRCSHSRRVPVQCGLQSNLVQPGPSLSLLCVATSAKPIPPLCSDICRSVLLPLDSTEYSGVVLRRSRVKYGYCSKRSPSRRHTPLLHRGRQLCRPQTSVVRGPLPAPLPGSDPLHSNHCI